MKMVKSLILGSAAGLIAMSGAQAADLPVKAKAVEYVKICSLYGAGFYYMPGTDTCLKIGGYVSAEYDFGQLQPSDIQTYNRNTALRTRDGDQMFMRARFNLNFDTRIATEYGVLRTYINEDIYFNTSNSQYNTPLTANNQSVIPSNVFIQFAGFTLGKAAPVTTVPFSATAGNGYFSAGIWGYSNATGAQVGQLQAVYTADLGNGLSITGGIADATYSRNPTYDSNTAITNPFTTGLVAGSATISGSAFTSTSNGGQYAPDFVANITLNQAWGGLYAAALVHEIHTTYYNFGPAGTASNFNNGHPDDVWGFGLIGGVQIKNLPTGVGDQVFLIGTYGDGVTNISGSPAPTATIFALRGYDNNQANNSIGYGNIVDGTFNGAGIGGSNQIQKTKSYGFTGAFEHWWVPGTWRTAVFGGYAKFDYNQTANTQFCVAAQRSVAAGGVALSGNSNCNFDVTVSQVGARTSWFPVKNLQLDVEAYYTHIDLPLTGTINPVPPAANGQALMPNAAYTLSSQNVFTGMVRAVRAF
jgi:hypothetical protein